MLLGELLEQWRDERYRSALALFKEAKLSFSYSVYADFERGVTLPSVEALLEIAKFFGKDPAEAILLWAQVQMPSPELKALFATRASSRVPHPSPSNVVAPPSLDNTWVFGPKEKPLLKKSPWLAEVLIALLNRFPEELPFSDVPAPKTVTAAALVKKVITPWITGGFVAATKTGIRLTHRHLYIPRTNDWDEIRVQNLRRALDAILKRANSELYNQDLCYFEVSHRQFTQEQAKQWIAQLRRMEKEYKSMPYVKNPSGEDRTHALVMVFGPRKLK